MLAKTTRLSVLSALLLALPAVVACSAETKPKADLEDDTPKKDKNKNTSSDSETPSEPEGPVGQGEPPVTPPPAPAAAPLIYAHTADTLFTFDAADKKLVDIGKFSCLSATDRVLDIAVDATGKVFGTTDDAFIAVNPKDATCTRIIAKDDLPNSLSFVPAGLVDAGKESLVGYAFDTSLKAVRYVKIDTTTGQMTDVGLLNPSGATKKYVSSGDIFSVANDGNKAFLTVREDPATTGPDMLAEVDPKTGTIKRIVGSTLQKQIYGLAYWAGKAYGFSGDGNVTEINVLTGVSNLVTTLKDKDNVAVPWFGAGVTTAAPTTSTK